MITDPRYGWQAWPWTLLIDQDVEAGIISFGLVGIPYAGPKVGENYTAYLVFQGLKTQGQPEADVLKVEWTIQNGPSAYVMVTDMWNPSAVGIDGAVNDVQFQHWASDVVVDCYSINITDGCDVLAAKVTKYDWADWDEEEDIDFNAKEYQI